MTHYNRALNKTYAGNDQPHSLKFSYSYELPFGKGKPFLAGGFGFTASPCLELVEHGARCTELARITQGARRAALHGFMS